MYPTRQCIANRQGDVSIVSISRAITIGTPQEDVALSKFTSSDNENEMTKVVLLIIVGTQTARPILMEH